MELIMEALEKNAKFFPNEVALVEINPAARPAAEMTWREYTLIETSAEGRYRRDMTWREFDTKANRFHVRHVDGNGFQRHDPAS